MACSGIGTGFGILLIILYFWEDIKKFIKENNVESENQTESENQEYVDPKYYDEDTAKEMR